MIEYSPMIYSIMIVPITRLNLVHVSDPVLYESRTHSELAEGVEI